MFHFQLPNKGIASLVAGIVSARTCENTVRDSRIVTPEIHNQRCKRKSSSTEYLSTFCSRYHCLHNRFCLVKNQNTYGIEYIE